MCSPASEGSCLSPSDPGLCLGRSELCNALGDDRCCGAAPIGRYRTRRRPCLGWLLNGQFFVWWLAAIVGGQDGLDFHSVGMSGGSFYAEIVIATFVRPVDVFLQFIPARA